MDLFTINPDGKTEFVNDSFGRLAAPEARLSIEQQKIADQMKEAATNPLEQHNWTPKTQFSQLQDDDGSQLTPRQTLNKRREILMRRYPQLSFVNQYCPTLFDARLGDREIKQEVAQGYGQAADVSVLSGAFDFPLVNNSVAEITDRLMAIGAAYETNWYQGLNDQLSGRDTRTTHMALARRALEEKLNLHCAFGTPKYGMAGVLNNPGMQQVVSAFNPYSPAADEQQLIDFIFTQVIDMTTRDLSTSMFTTLEIPMNLAGLFLRTRMTNTSQNIWSYITANMSEFLNGRALRVVSMPELNAPVMQQYGGLAANQEKLIITNLDTDSMRRTAVSAIPTEMPAEAPKRGKTEHAMFYVTSGVRIIHQEDHLSFTYPTA